MAGGRVETGHALSLRVVVGWHDSEGTEAWKWGLQRMGKGTNKGVQIFRFDSNKSKDLDSFPCLRVFRVVETGHALSLRGVQLKIRQGGL